MLAQAPLLCSELDTAPAMPAFILASDVDEEVHRRAGAHADHAARLHIGRGGLADQGLEFILRHVGRIESRLRRIVPISDNRRTPWHFVPYALARPFLFGLDPEIAHELTLASLARLQGTPAQCAWSQPRVDDPVTLAGLSFPNRIGLAAGLDKNGRCIDGLGAMGFGFIEVGTVTPKAQPGNPKPRMFRLPQADALINRLGFNNEGLAAFLANVQRARRFRQRGGILGLNIGKNAATPIGTRGGRLPRVPGRRLPACRLRGRQHLEPEHEEPARACRATRRSTRCSRRCSRAALELAAAHGRSVPMFVKIAPDLDETQVALIAQTLTKQRHRRRDRDQHDDGARRREGPAACRRGRRPERQAGLRSRATA